MGSGDWNDGMNRVGRQGRGESTWLGFFLHGVLADFAALCDGRGDAERAERYRREAARLAAALERTWDGEWYRRGYYDDGAPLGSAQNEECRIDSIAQSWAVLSGAVPRRVSPIAPWTRCVPTWCGAGTGCWPCSRRPSTARAQEPGYIKGYPPGVRENGGQYTHAAVWAVMAMARLGYGDEAVELFHMLNPANHTRTRGRRRALQGRALRPRGRRLRAPVSRRPRRLDLVHRLGGLDVPRRPREHPRPAAVTARPSRSTPASRRPGPRTRSPGASARRSTPSTSRTRSAAREGWPRPCSTEWPSTRLRFRSRTTAAGTS